MTHFIKLRYININSIKFKSVFTKTQHDEAN
jgi:hypothetical protein